MSRHLMKHLRKKSECAKNTPPCGIEEWEKKRGKGPLL